MLVSSFQYYVIIYYVFGGDIGAGAEYAGYAGTLGAISTFFVIIFVTWLSTRIGKRRAFYITIISSLSQILFFIIFFTLLLITFKYFVVGFDPIMI